MIYRIMSFLVAEAFSSLILMMYTPGTSSDTFNSLELKCV